MQLVLYAVLAVVLVATALAALLLVAERLLVNYGLCRIDINNGAKKFEVEGGQPLLSSLMGQGVYIPSACGGRGTCALCKVKVLEGGGPVVPTETPLLSADEIERNIRISCQIKVRNDVAIEIPEELLFVKEYRGKAAALRDLTHDIKELVIDLDDPPQIEFEAGQYVQLQAPAYGGNPEPVFRAYSMSSQPQVKDRIELIVRLVPGGICTTWVFNHLKVGDEVTFTGPYGEFRISDSDEEMVWIAGGSGMAPFWSMIRDLKARGVRRRVTYFFGALSKRDLFLLDELRALEQELDWFTFIPALSAPKDEDQWQGERGLITEVVARHTGDGASKEAYLCGSPGMIDAAIRVLREHGVTDDRIYYDKFA